jgi:hypothetical protein
MTIRGFDTRRSGVRGFHYRKISPKNYLRATDRRRTERSNAIVSPRIVEYIDDAEKSGDG